MWNLTELDCGRVLTNDEHYISEFIKKHGRIKLISDPLEGKLPMDCHSIRRRQYFPEKADRDSREYPLAYARIVYKVVNGRLPK